MTNPGPVFSTICIFLRVSFFRLPSFLNLFAISLLSASSSLCPVSSIPRFCRRLRFLCHLRFSPSAFFRRLRFYTHLRFFAICVFSTTCIFYYVSFSVPHPRFLRFLHLFCCVRFLHSLNFVAYCGLFSVFLLSRVSLSPLESMEKPKLVVNSKSSVLSDV